MFAESGLHGASTEEIARRAGISQPYVFRLFGTKKELFIAVVARCFRQTLEMFQRAAEGMRGEEALHAMGEAYGAAARRRPDVPARPRCRRTPRATTRRSARSSGTATATSSPTSSASPAREPARVASFFAAGMLMNVLASMELQEPTEPWAQRLLDGCKQDE